MLRALFPRSGTKYADSRFGREMNEFYEWLRQAGYSKDNIRGHLRRLFSVLTRSRKFDAYDARSSGVLHRVFGRYCTSVKRSEEFRGTQRAYCRFLRAQSRLREDVRPKIIESSLLRQYRQYLKEV